MVEVAISLIAGLFGLAIGSFLNVVVWRVPRGESVSLPPSHCPHCDKPIRPWDNIPVVSWLILRAKCRDCGGRIATRYPLVELATGVAFTGVSFLVLNGTILSESVESPVVVWLSTALVLVAFLYLVAISLALVLIDLDHHRLPNSIVIPAYVVGGVLLGLASILVGDYSALLRGAIGMVSLFAGYLLVALAYPGGMGFGDVKLAGVLGLFLAWCGWGQFSVGVFSAFVLGGVFSVALVLVRRATRKSAIPFGPWMIAGAWVGILFGAHIWSGYLASFGIAI